MERKPDNKDEWDDYIPFEGRGVGTRVMSPEEAALHLERVKRARAKMNERKAKRVGGASES